MPSANRPVRVLREPVGGPLRRGAVPGGPTCSLSWPTCARGASSWPRARGRFARWLRAALERGLSYDPDEREYPNMEALLAALAQDPRGPWRRRLGAAAALVAIAAAALVVVVHHRAELRGCEALAHRLDGAWDEPRRREVHDAFRGDPCGLRRGRVRPHDPDPRRVRGGPFAIGRHDLRGGTRGLVMSGRAAMPATASASPTCWRWGTCSPGPTRTSSSTPCKPPRVLPDVATCAGSDPLGDRTEPTDPALRTQVRALEERLGVAEVSREAGRSKEGVELAALNVAEAEQVGFLPLLAEARLDLGRAQWESEDRRAADGTLRGDAGRRSGRVSLASVPGPGLPGRWWRRVAANGRWPTSASTSRRGVSIRLGDQGALRGELLLRRGERLSDRGESSTKRAP